MSSLPVRIARARRALGLAAALRGATLGATVVIVVLILGTAADALIALPIPLRRTILPLAVVMGAAMFLSALWRRIAPAWTASDEAIALWFERRMPSLRYALVTSIDANVLLVPPPVARQVATAALEPEVWLAARALLVRPVVALAVAALVLFSLPSGAVARLTAPQPGDALARVGASARPGSDPLATIVVRVFPPAYAGLGVIAIDDPSSVSALAGSRVVVEGRGAGVAADLESRRLTPTERDGTWRVAFVVPQRATGLRLQGPARDRVLVVEPIADSVPVVRLDAPVRDSVLRIARGALVLSAALHDDHGLADAGFEYIVSAGAGESFTFRGGRVSARTFGPGVIAGRIEGTLSLDTLGLAPGDLLHLRAVGRDRNDVTGPGHGFSETRTIRIARSDEYDSVSVDPMPPTEPEKGALSQRMLLLLTVELRDRSRGLGAPTAARESRRLAGEQTTLRRRVGEVIFIRLSADPGEHAHFAGDGHDHGAEQPLDPDQVLATAERAANVDAARMLERAGDESPVVAINRPLLEAYNHMWRASTELETENPSAAIPWMQRALEALQRARAAERIYLRGRPPRVLVDVAKVRGTGRDRGTPSARESRAPLDADRADRLARFDAALGLVATDPGAATDALLLLRLSLPANDLASAQALNAAADAVRRGGDVTVALQRARRSLAGAPIRQDALLPWGG